MRLTLLLWMLLKWMLFNKVGVNYEQKQKRDTENKKVDDENQVRRQKTKGSNVNSRKNCM